LTLKCHPRQQATP